MGKIDKKVVIDKLFEEMGKKVGKDTGVTKVTKFFGTIGKLVSTGGKLSDNTSVEVFGNKIQEAANNNKVENVVTPENVTALAKLAIYYPKEMIALAKLAPKIISFKIEDTNKYPNDHGKEAYKKRLDEHFKNDSDYKLINK